MSDLSIRMTFGLLPLALIGFAIFHRNKPAFIVSLLGFGLYLMAYVTSLFGAKVMNSIRDDLSYSVWRSVPLDHSASAVAVAGIGSVLGALVVAVIRSAKSGPAVGTATNSVKLLVQKRAALLLGSGALGVVAYMSIFGWSALISRSQYIPPLQIPALGSTLGVLGPVIFVLAIVVAQSTSGRLRAVAWIEVVAIALIFLGSASRMLALLPLLAIVLASLLRGRLGAFRFIGALLLSTLAAASVLELRMGINGHFGLQSFIPALFTDGIAIVSEGLRATLANVLFAVPLTGAVQSADRFDAQALIISLSASPFSGGEWEKEAPLLRLHAFIPFNALGELASLGLVPLFIAMFLISLVTSALLTALAKRGLIVPFLAVVALFMLASVLLLQYNLRSVSRVLYSAWAVAVIAMVVLPLIRRKSDRDALSGRNLSRAEASRSSARD